jgi:hypothetical protein
LTVAFPSEITELAWNRSNQLCECTKTGHGHSGRCNRPLTWENRCDDGVGGWEQRHIHPAGADTLDNCEILCHDCFTRLRREALATESEAATES